MVWDLERQHSLGQLQGHDDTITAVAARGSLAVSYQNSGPVKTRVWNLETLQCTATLPAREDDSDTWSACCMDDRVLLGQKDGIIKLWDIAESAPVALVDLAGHTLSVRSVKASAAGSTVLSGSDDKAVRLWDMRTSRCVRTMEGHSRGVMSVDIDGQCRTAVSGSVDSTVKLWDMGSGRCMETYECHDFVRDVVMHESGSSFLSSSMCDSIVTTWAVGCSREVMRADMASLCVPDTDFTRLFARKDLSSIALCSISDSQFGVSFWR